MQNNDNELYGVKYSGNLLDGFTIKESAILLQKNARMNIEAIKRLISLRDSIIKKDISLESANNLVKILRGCGLDCSCVPMRQNKAIIEQQQSERINDMIKRMSNNELCNAILLLGNQRVKEIAFALMKETTKDSLGSLKENAEEKLSSLKSSNMPLVHISATRFKNMKVVQLLKSKFTPKKIMVIGIATLVLIIGSYFMKSSHEPDTRVAPEITHGSQPRGNERYDINQLSRIK